MRNGQIYTPVAQTSLKQRNVMGGTGPDRVEEALRYASLTVNAEQARLTSIRQARLSDVDAIENIISYWSQAQENLPRKREDILRSIQKNYRLRASWRGARLIEAQKAKHEMEAAIANAAGNPELPPHLEGTESSDILSHHYRKAIEASQIRPRHLRKAVNAEMKKTATYDSSMINVFEMREMGLDKILYEDEMVRAL